jgi:hypothetical protein
MKFRGNWAKKVPNAGKSLLSEFVSTIKQCLGTIKQFSCTIKYDGKKLERGRQYTKC